MTEFTLPRSTPEAQGVASKAILKMLDALKEKQYKIHSLMLLRHGNVIAEGWWKPYARDHKRYVYSLSKSFTSSAIGFAVAEGLLTVEDKVISFFPDDLPEVVSENPAAMRIKDLLTMTAGLHCRDRTDETVTRMIKRSDWIQFMLDLPMEDDPGTEFNYCNGVSHLLSGIVHEVTGMTALSSGTTNPTTAPPSPPFARPMSNAAMRTANDVGIGCVFPGEL